MKYRILIFDFDGTIADTLKYLLNIGNGISEEFNFKKVSPHEVKKLQDKTSQEIIKYLHIPVIKIPAIASRVKKELNENIGLINPAPHLKEVLRTLRKKDITLGILTSNTPNNVAKFLKIHRLDFFDFINATSRIWSKHIGLNKLVKEHKLNKKEILYIGDEIRDIQAAKKANVKIAAVSWGYNSKKALKANKPDYLLDKPRELLGFI